MAIFLTPLTDGMTSGEKRFAKLLKDCLSDEYLVWFDIPVGTKRRIGASLHPDFIVMHPHQGITVLEVKDWKTTTIQSLNAKTATLMVDGQVKEAKSPLEQARNYKCQVMNLLESDPALIQSDGAYTGRLVVPCNYGVVFANIKRSIFERNDFSSVIPSDSVICQDEMADAVTPEVFTNQFLQLQRVRFPVNLTNEQIDRVRYHLFPDIRISAPVEEDVIPDIVQVMDLEQEKLARSLGDGHRIIRGVAGSGKTLVLINRALQLAEEAENPILVICYNIVLASKLRHILRAKGDSDRIVVHHFHGWCKHILKQYRIPRPRWQNDTRDGYIRELEEKVLQAVDTGEIPQGIYGAVLIDEAHDLEPAWLELLAKMPHPDKKHLLVLHDDAQNLYQGRERPVWSRLGIQARGRTRALKVNYRNTYEVATWAHQFASDMFIENIEIDDDVPQIVVPEVVDRHGVFPRLVRRESFRDEVKYIAHGIKGLNEKGRSWSEIAILYAFVDSGRLISDTLKNHGIPVSWLKSQQERLDFDPEHPSVKLMPIKSSKGLEFPVVCIPGVDQMERYDERVKVMYVGMTRSTDKLVLTYRDRDQGSMLVDKLKAALPEALPANPQVLNFPEPNEGMTA